MKQESDSFQFENTTEWESAGVGVIRQIMAYNKNMMMVKVKFETGAEGAPHTHPHTQATYVVSGIFEFTVGGETEIVLNDYWGKLFIVLLTRSLNYFSCLVDIVV